MMSCRNKRAIQVESAVGGGNDGPLDDGIHRAAEQQAHGFFTFAHLGFRPQPSKFRRRPLGEYFEDRINSRLFRYRSPIDDRHVAKNHSVPVLKRHAQIADSTGLSEFILVRVYLQNAVRKVDQPGRVDDALAGGPGDINFIVLHPLPVHPEGKGSEAALLREIFRDPGSMCPQGTGKVFHQCREKSVAGFRCGALKNRAQDGIGFQAMEGARIILLWRRHDGDGVSMK